MCSNVYDDAINFYFFSKKKKEKTLKGYHMVKNFF